METTGNKDVIKIIPGTEEDENCFFESSLVLEMLGVIASDLALMQEKEPVDEAYIGDEQGSLCHISDFKIMGDGDRRRYFFKAELFITGFNRSVARFTLENLLLETELELKLMSKDEAELLVTENKEAVVWN